MLSWDYPPRVTGGTAAHAAGLGRALVEAGHDVVVLTISDRITAPDDFTLISGMVASVHCDS